MKISTTKSLIVVDCIRSLFMFEKLVHNFEQILSCLYKYLKYHSKKYGITRLFLSA